jgi:hypothetical protein
MQMWFRPPAILCYQGFASVCPSRATFLTMICVIEMFFYERSGNNAYHFNPINHSSDNNGH